MQAGPRCGHPGEERVGVARCAPPSALSVGHVAGLGDSRRAWQELGLGRLAESPQLITGNRPHTAEDEKAQDKCET